jgi:rRNA-processing protein FCF1
VTEPPQPVRGSRLLLDADVLYPIRICDFILTAATLGLTQRPVVSDVILDEAQRNISTDRPALIEAVQRRFAAVRRSTDAHGLAIPKRFVDDEIINAKDRHVMAAARFHDVDVIVSNDKRLRREVDAWAANHRARVRAWSADELAARLLDEDRSAVVETIEAMAARMTNPPRSTEEVLAVLVESLPSLGALTTHDR